jgi:aryl-alcohol dehydrogenase-like predicted oxidoreductase
MALPQRELGKSGIKVTAEGLGLMSLSGTYGPSDDAAGVKLIHEALDRGVTFLDSSDAYGKGHNETLLGNALKGRRQGVIVATKFGNLGGAGGKFADGRPEFVIESCEASLKRLGVDVIDVYYQHRVDPLVPIEDTVGAMKKLVEQGKVRALGLSEAAPDTIRRAHKVHPIAALQSEYSLLYREAAEEALKATRELGISFVAYAPIARGLLSEEIADPATLAEGDTRKRQPRYSGDNLAHNKSLAQKVQEMAKKKGCTTAQLAIAWVLAQGPDLVTIPGTKHSERLAENLGALDVKLTPDEVKSLSNAIPAGAAKGSRYPDGQMKSLHI